MNPEYISVHIPRTGGSTFGLLLEIAVGIGRMAFVDPPRIMPDLIAKGLMQRWKTATTTYFCEPKFETAKEGHFVVVHGQLAPRPWMDKFPNAKTIVWLRHPIARLLSAYWYWYAGSRRYRNLSFMAFAEHELNRNQLTNYYLKDVDLKEFDFVGITERMDTDIDDLLDLGLDIPVYLSEMPDGISLPENPSICFGGRTPIVRETMKQGYRLTEPVGLRQFTPDELGHLVQLNDLDMAMYERALTLRALRVLSSRPKEDLCGSRGICPMVSKEAVPYEKEKDSSA